MSSLIDQAAKNDNISTIFVVNAQQKFYGAIDLKNLIIARRDETLEDLTVTSYPYVYAEEPINESSGCRRTCASKGRERSRTAGII